MEINEKIKIGSSDLEKISKISRIIRRSETFFVAGHVKPDGDSLGSALALASVLKRFGKKVCVYSSDETPDFLKFLKGTDEIKRMAKKGDMFDCAIVLESLDFSRMGNIITPKQAKKIINIDHHFAHTNFGNVNYVVPSSASTAELVLNILEYMKVKLTKNEAESLYTGILNDTGRFQQTNTTPDSHVACARLMRFGINVNDIYKKIYENNSINTLRLRGLALYGIKTILNNHVSYIVLRRNMFKKLGSKNLTTDGIINYTLKVKNVKIGCLFGEIDKKTTRISCRSVKDFNVLEVMRKFGGGGHKNAAGCIIKTGINASIKLISNVLKEKLNSYDL
ncbi:MAG: bifunctional oligoribonuclease/PAP phosphatase NrnA [Endomicrobium sp.]|jgi:phosphoesterase RecJ-like protein|nr:bifunctional oligoribonuclease/PAP phosphatase NrnA [Endomicrobium sp.]